MRIKRIELNGFKSFLERTVLELPLGVTAIVGPNGCGKSNIVAAIRWVLGEQSPKHLRGEAMEDVIFTGNGESGPLGMAEVTLLLERDERDLERRPAGDDGDGIEETLPAALAEASEIAVTRRYFRSGESEYFINRMPCRLRDITELFLGTGIGTKAYAIIEQGRVEQLVNAKPEEVRLFIEEAAGTTRFRSRKLAAERKMERTRDNLVRVEDVLREIERQMASLERQARRAEEYHRIKDGLRALDLRVMAARQRAWSEEARALGERLAAVRAEEAQLHDAIRRSRGATVEARARRSADEDRLRVCDGEIAEQRLRAGQARTLGASLAVRQTELVARAADAERELGVLRLRLGDLEEESRGAAEALERAAAEERDAEARLEALAAECTPLDRMVEEAKDAVVEASAEESRLHNMGEALRRRHEELEGRRRKLEDEQRLLGERLRTNARDAEAAREAITRLEEERVRLGTDRQALAERQLEIRREEAVRGTALEGAREAARQMGSRADSLRELHARHEGCKRGAAGLLARQPGTAALVASVLRLPAALERAVAAALGARLGQIVVPDTASAVAAVGWLRESNAGSATVLPRDAERRAAVIVPAGRRLLDQIDVDPQHWALAEALLGQVLLADDLGHALALWRAASHAVTVVTPAGEAIDTVGAVTGGSEPPLEETLLARTRELRELDGMLAAARADVAREERALAEIQARDAELTEAARAADERLQVLRLELLAAEKDRERL